MNDTKMNVLKPLIIGPIEQLTPIHEHYEYLKGFEVILLTGIAINNHSSRSFTLGRNTTWSQR